MQAGVLNSLEEIISCGHVFVFTPGSSSQSLGFPEREWIRGREWGRQPELSSATPAQRAPRAPPALTRARSCGGISSRGAAIFVQQKRPGGSRFSPRGRVEAPVLLSAIDTLRQDACFPAPPSVPTVPNLRLQASARHPRRCPHRR